jgi:putative oxygen-independent coproporphyrinogen III oxidase
VTGPLSAGPVTGEPPGHFGVYVHIPFCARRCDYCSFATWDDRHHLVDRYVDCVRRELVSHRVHDPVATSVFFGGGTPSMLDADVLMSLLDLIECAPDVEVTVECNPDTVTVEMLQCYRRHGVNRISLGVQSMVPHVLRALGRTHDIDNVARAVDAIGRVGFASFNVDLIYGAVGESAHDWIETLTGVLALEPPHVSAYALTVEAGTPLAADVARHPDDDSQAQCYLDADRILADAGLSNYEISNWARPGHECRHNLLYWRQGEYRAAGCAAHGHLRGRRYWNVRTPERYCDLIESHRSPEAGCEALTAEERRLEGLQLSIRTSDGVPAESLDVTELDGFVDVDDAGRAHLTLSGRLLANEVALRLR